MPFTPTHILGVLPVHFSFRRLSLPALMIGSMIPDFPMFYPISSYSFSHSAIGLIGYCLPMGIAIYYLWELLGKALMIDVSPLWIRYRINDYRSTKPRYTFIDIPVVAIALIVGSITHIVWDSFTHKGEWGVELMPWLNQQTAIFALPGYKVFQYGSTFIGLPLLAVLCFFYLKNNKSDTNSQYYLFQKSWLFAIANKFHRHMYCDRRISNVSSRFIENYCRHNSQAIHKCRYNDVFPLCNLIQDMAW